MVREFHQYLKELELTAEQGGLWCQTHLTLGAATLCGIGWHFAAYVGWLLVAHACTQVWFFIAKICQDYEQRGG